MIACFVFNVVESAPMAAKRTKSRRGGRRPGAGRKPMLTDARTLTVTFDGPDYDTVARQADKRDVSLGTVIREAVKAYVSRRRR